MESIRSLMDEETSKVIRDNEHLEPFKLRHTRNLIIRVAYDKIKRHVPLTDRQRTLEFIDDKFNGLIQ